MSAVIPVTKPVILRTSGRTWNPLYFIRASLGCASVPRVKLNSTFSGRPPQVLVMPLPAHSLHCGMLPVVFLITRRCPAQCIRTPPSTPLSKIALISPHRVPMRPVSWAVPSHPCTTTRLTVRAETTAGPTLPPHAPSSSPRTTPPTKLMCFSGMHQRPWQASAPG